MLWHKTDKANLKEQGVGTNHHGIVPGQHQGEYNQTMRIHYTASTLLATRPRAGSTSATYVKQTSILAQLEI